MDSQQQIPQNWLKRFLTIWIGQAFSILGSRLVSFALVWWMTRQTGSAVVLATASAVHYLPQIFLGPFVGALVDRWNRRRVLIIADSAVAAATLVLAFLFWADLIQIWHIYALMLLRALGGTFHWPAMQASMTLLVPDKHLARVAGFNQILDGGVSLLGPALGALLMETLPVQGVLAIDVLTAVIAVGALLVIAIPQPVKASEGVRLTPAVVWRDVVEGFRFVAAWRGLLIILGVAMLVNFFSAPTGTYLPLLITDYFKGGVWHLGLVESLAGAGMIAGGLILGVWGGFKRKVVNIVAGLMIAGTAYLVVGLVPETLFVVAAAALSIEGIANTMSNGGANALLQSLIRADVQGRVFGLIACLTSLCSPLALMISAPIVERVGVQPLFTFSGVLFIIMAVSMFFIRDVIHIESSAYVKAKIKDKDREAALIPSGESTSH